MAQAGIAERALRTTAAAGARVRAVVGDDRLEIARQSPDFGPGVPTAGR